MLHSIWRQNKNAIPSVRILMEFTDDTAAFKVTLSYLLIPYVEKTDVYSHGFCLELSQFGMPYILLLVYAVNINAFYSSFRSNSPF